MVSTQFAQMNNDTTRACAAHLTPTSHAVVPACSPSCTAMQPRCSVWLLTLVRGDTCTARRGQASCSASNWPSLPLEQSTVSLTLLLAQLANKTRPPPRKTVLCPLRQASHRAHTGPTQGRGAGHSPLSTRPSPPGRQIASDGPQPSQHQIKPTRPAYSQEGP